VDGQKSKPRASTLAASPMQEGRQERCARPHLGASARHPPV